MDFHTFEVKNNEQKTLKMWCVCLPVNTSLTIQRIIDHGKYELL